ncbi:MAG: hypothetical protein ACYC27_05380 [Armatimonadota bacterium]
MKLLALMGCLSTLSIGMVGLADAKGIETIGLYPFEDIPEQHQFLKECGFNMLQVWDTGFRRKPELLDDFYTGLAKDVRNLQKDGFKVWIVLSSNMKQWPGPKDMGPGAGLRFYPRNRPDMEVRLEYIRKAVKALKHADGFSFFGGDPGGVPKELGPCGIQDWIQMGREVGQIVKKEAPKAEYNVNPWAVTQWEDEGMDVFAAEFWQKEVSNSKAVVDEEGFLNANTGIEFCPHNYYRSLALTIFDKDGITPELYPDKAAVDKAKVNGVKRLWSWPYFLVDEVDDGYTGTDGVSYGQTQAETRYLHRIVNQLRDIGLNGVIANGSPASCKAEALNTYAFARFCQDPRLTPEGVINEYAGYIADPGTKAYLVDVIKFIENHSTWQNGLPEKNRLPDFECRSKSAKQASALLSKVKPNHNPGFHLPESPADYIPRLQRRLDIIAKTEL